MIQKITVFSGAGMSAESGISTFRDNGGLWEKHNIYEVATPEAWRVNQELVLEFYNQRRKQLLEVEPNEAHKALVLLEEHFEINIVIQNIDDLHERAGSKKVIHLHGELRKSQSSENPNMVYDIEGWELKKGDICSNGSQLRPHVVWFGEEVPMMSIAENMVRESDLLLVIGTSLNVYPAANLLYDVKKGTPIIVIDPSEMDISHHPNSTHLRKKAEEGLKEIASKLLNGKHHW